MTNSLITCAYTLTAVGAQSIATLTPRFAAVPLDLTIPRLFGLLPESDSTAAPVGTSVTRTIVFRMVPNTPAAASIVLLGGQPLGKIAHVSLSVAGFGYAKPPIVSFGTPGAKGQAHARGQVVSGIVLQGGSGYTGATVATFVGGEVEPTGTVAKATPNISAGVITGVTMVSAGQGYQSYPDIVFTDSGGGSGASGIGALEVENVVVDNPGDGYSASTPVTLTPVFPASFPDASQAGGANGQGQVLQGWMLQELQQALNTTYIVAAVPVVS